MEDIGNQTTGPIKVIDIDRNNEKNGKDEPIHVIDINGKGKKENYTSKGKIRKKTRKIGKILALIGATGLVAFGSMKTYSAYKDTQEILEEAENIEDLNLDEEMKERLNEFVEALDNEESLTDEEVIKLNKDITKFQEELLKSKVGNSLGIPDEEIDDSISLRPSEGDMDEDRIVVEDANGEVKIINHLPFSIREYLDKMENGQHLDTNETEGRFNREKFLKQCQVGLKLSKIIAVAETYIDTEKGKLTLVYPEKEENQTTTEIEQQDDEREL